MPSWPPRCGPEVEQLGDRKPQPRGDLEDDERSLSGHNEPAAIRTPVHPGDRGKVRRERPVSRSIGTNHGKAVSVRICNEVLDRRPGNDASAHEVVAAAPGAVLV